MNNHGDGVSCSGTKSTVEMKDCLVQGNGGSGLGLAGECKAQLTKCRFVRNGEILNKDDGSSCTPCTGNVAIMSSAQKPLPGFRIENENEDKSAAKVPSSG